MDMIWTGLFIFLLILALGLNVFSLPGIWVILALLAVWKFFRPEIELTWTFWGFLCALGALAEILEFVVQAWGTKKYGGTTAGNVGGIIGAIIGAILGASCLLGFGAIPGALAGAFLGCYLLEIIRGLPHQSAMRAAWGSFWGKMLGMSLKFGVGIGIIIMAGIRIWPGDAPALAL